MKLPRRAPLALAALTVMAAQALAQTTPLQVIAQQPPGSGSDAMTRAWAECAARQTGQPNVVMNKPGANGILAINHLKGLPADGANVMSIGMSQMTITPFVHRQMPYDPIKDFDGIAVIGTSPLVLAVPASAGIRKLADLEKLAKSQPGGLNFGSPGKGSPAHLLTTALTEAMDWPATHVPFVGEAAGLNALMGNHIQAMTLVIGTAATQVKAGKLVPLAVFAAERSALMPDVPTIAEAGGPTVLARPAWIAVVAKKGTPAAVVTRLNDATNKCRTDSTYVERMTAMSVSLVSSKPGDVQAFAERDIAVWKPLIDKLGLATE
ncbi:MAG: tripartite tricarboxylate transporter substrate binding protein [Acidovorax sp.]|jgi:tripartite-type tricarboxylate transporter receptor subunit TctC|uniref:Bug family tripartite tricarboxylate transporter substrate binding protein n=1 Tax=Acidovorax sp. TaxID=1872122 RepID=UPI0026303C73|nr:tripartite tricarboxylate transporter substrate binding protein [Acidovorax sp.]MDH4464606.1 tripartite tricarboxylate transporter substrate binding protein [Acidovorax sp.]